MSAIVGEVHRVRGRLSSKQLNSFKPSSSQLKLGTTAANALLSVIYGAPIVNGRVAAYGFESPLKLVILVVWGYGECHQIKTVYINDEDVANKPNIKTQHYRGTAIQAKDLWVNSVVPAYTDDLVLSHPSGDKGICYSVFKIPTSELTSAPRFQAHIEGQLVYDPDSSSTGDPFYDDVGFSVEFTNVSPNDQATDDSTNGHTVTFHGSAHVANNELVLVSSTSDYVSIADHASVEPGVEPWSLELRCTPDTVVGTQALCSKGSLLTPDLGVSLSRNGVDLDLSISSTGSSYDIISETVATGVFTVAESVDIKLEFTGYSYLVFVNGTRKKQEYTTDALFDSIQAWQLGALQGLVTFDGKFQSWRLTVGNVRYGSRHNVVSGSPQTYLATPFADSDTYTPGYVYSDNPALCAGELISNQVYGMGAAVTGLSEASAWCDSLLGGAVSRSKIALSLSQSKKTDDWVDLLCSYADCQWFNDGSGATIIPDKPIGATNPSGQELATNYDFAINNSDWNPVGFSWVGTLYIPTVTSPETTGSLSQLQPTEAGVKYVITVNCVAMSAGSFTVEFDGVEVIAAQTAAGEYSVEVTATAGSPMPLLELKTNETCNGWFVSLSFKRLYWLEETFVKDSISLEGLSNNDTPTRVNLRYTESSDTSPNWEEKIASYELPGVDTGDVPLIETSVSMPGVYREDEANNKAESRLLRMQNRVRVSWVSTDIGLAYQRGTVIQVRNTHRNIDILVLVESVTMVSYGRYRVTGLRYDEEHYPSELVEGTGTIPIGAITLLSGSTVPDGWSAWSLADGKFLKMWSEATSPHEVPGDTGGAATHAGFSGNTTTDGAHSPGSTTKFNIPKIVIDDPGVALFKYTVDADGLEKGDHLHTYSTGTITPNPYRRDSILIKKDSPASTTFPASAMVFGLANINIPNLTRTVAYQNRLLAAATSPKNAGAASKFVTLTTGSTDDSHAHHTKTLFSNQTWEVDFLNHWWEPETGGGAHTHSLTAELTRNIKRYKLALYAGSDEFTVTPGLIMFWDGGLVGSPEPLPSDWVVCDGNNGTPDLRDFYIEIAATGAEGTSVGDNTISYSDNTSTVTHDHDGTEDSEGKKVITAAHSNSEAHNHGIDDSDDWQPEYYVVYPIMFTG